MEILQQAADYISLQTKLGPCNHLIPLINTQKLRNAINYLNYQDFQKDSLEHGLRGKEGKKKLKVNLKLAILQMWIIKM